MHLTTTVVAVLSRGVMAGVGCEDMSKAHRIAAGGLLITKKQRFHKLIVSGFQTSDNFL
jgi:hypothetical protein